MSKIGKTEWVGVYVVAGIIDVAQWLADATGIGAGVNEIIDPFIGVGFAGYFQLRDVSMITHISRLLSLVGATALEEVTVSAAPAWIADVWYIHKTVRSEEAEISASQQQEEFLQAGQVRKYVENGIGRVRNEEIQESNNRKLYMDGVGRPRGRVQSAGPTLGQVNDNEEMSLSE